MDWTRYIDLRSWLIESESIYTDPVHLLIHRTPWRFRSVARFFSPRLFLCISKWNETLRRIWNAAGDERCERIYLLWVMVLLFIGETMAYVSLYFSPKKNPSQGQTSSMTRRVIRQYGPSPETNNLPGLIQILGLSFLRLCIIHHYCTRRLCSEEWQHCIH